MTHPESAADAQGVIPELGDAVAKYDHHAEQVMLSEEQVGQYTVLQLNTGLKDEPGVISASIAEVNGKPKAMVEGFGVTNRDKGEGTRLMQALIVSLKQRGVHELWSYSVSTDALRFRERFFGEAKLHFYDSDHPEKGFLPLTVDEVIATSERLDELRQPQAPRVSPIRPATTEHKFGICVSLDEVDSSSWAEPTPSSRQIGDLVLNISKIPTHLALDQAESVSELKEAA